MSDIDRLRAVRAGAARRYATAADGLANALETDRATEPCVLMLACSRAWNELVHADRDVRAWVLASDPIDDFYREQAALDSGAEGEPK